MSERFALQISPLGIMRSIILFLRQIIKIPLVYQPLTRGIYYFIYTSYETLRFTESQIISILSQQEKGIPVKDICRYLEGRFTAQPLLAPLLLHHRLR